MVKSVILARGKGTRMQRREEGIELEPEQARMADAGLKAMVPFNGRPFLDYLLSALADAGCRDVCLVVAPDHDEIRDHYDRHRPRRVRLSFAVQLEPRGTADALLFAQPFCGDQPFLAMNADNYYPPEVLRQLSALDGPGLPAFSRRTLLGDGNTSADRIRHYAILRITADGTLDDIVEKPGDDELSALGDEYFVSMNCWRLDRTIFDACRRVEPSPRGEYELPNAVRYAIHVLHHRFRTFPAQGRVLDLSHRSDVAGVARHLRAIEVEP